MTGDRKRYPKSIVTQASMVSGLALQTEQLSDEHTLHGNGDRGTDIRQECSFQR